MASVGGWVNTGQSRAVDGVQRQRNAGRVEVDAALGGDGGLDAIAVAAVVDDLGAERADQRVVPEAGQAKIVGELAAGVERGGAGGKNLDDGDGVGGGGGIVRYGEPRFVKAPGS